MLMELSKAFDCIWHYLIIAKLVAYELDNTALKLIFSYSKNQKQCVRINNTYSNFKNITSGYGTIIRIEITCMKTPCYMRDSACRWFIKTKIF